MKRLHDILFPALYYAFAAFDASLKLILLQSREYKLLLISSTTKYRSCKNVCRHLGKEFGRFFYQRLSGNRQVGSSC
jgi:hypothetical protein